MNERENGQQAVISEEGIIAGGSFDYAYPKEFEDKLRFSLELGRVRSAVLRFLNDGAARFGVFGDPAGE